MADIIVKKLDIDGNGQISLDELMAWFDQHPDSDVTDLFTLLNEVRAPLVPRIHVRGADLFERGRLLTRPRASMPLILLHPSMAMHGPKGTTSTLWNGPAQEA